MKDGEILSHPDHCTIDGQFFEAKELLMTTYRIFCHHLSKCSFKFLSIYFKIWSRFCKEDYFKLLFPSLIGERKQRNIEDLTRSNYSKVGSSATIPCKTNQQQKEAAKISVWLLIDILWLNWKVLWEPLCGIISV